MIRTPRFPRAVLAALALGTASVPARAEPPNAKAMPVYVLSLWTDDADDQADALTQALRWRVRQAPGWSLLETPQSFETLAIALKCPPRPDPPCLQRIGDQLHADHYVWGTIKKRSGNEVSAELHLWSRGKRDLDASETYGDNLKEPSDESLRTIAARILGKLTGVVASSTLVVRAGNHRMGVVLIDGAERGMLENGAARISLPSGPHTVGVRVAGFEAPEQTADLVAGSEQEVTFALTPLESPPAEETAASPFPVGKVLGYSAIIAGAGFIVAGGIEALNWLNDSNTSSDDRNRVPASVTDVCANPVNVQAQDACSRSKDALTASTLGWVFTGVGALLVGTGVLILTSESGSSEGTHSASARDAPNSRLELLPALGLHTASIDVRVRF